MQKHACLQKPRKELEVSSKSDSRHGYPTDEFKILATEIRLLTIFFSKPRTFINRGNRCGNSPAHNHPEYTKYDSERADRYSPSLRTLENRPLSPVTPHGDLRPPFRIVTGLLPTLQPGESVTGTQCCCYDLVTRLEP